MLFLRITKGLLAVIVAIIAALLFGWIISYLLFIDFSDADKELELKAKLFLGLVFYGFCNGAAMLISIFMQFAKAPKPK